MYIDITLRVSTDCIHIEAGPHPNSSIVFWADRDDRTAKIRDDDV